MSSTDLSAYDQFYDAFEEFNFPHSKSSDALAQAEGQSWPKDGKAATEDQGFMTAFFKAVEVSSFPQLQSSQSLASIQSSASLSPMRHARSSAEFNAQMQFFQAVQTLVVTNSNSGHALASLEETKPAEKSLFEGIFPTIVDQFVSLYNDFMQNYPQEA